MDFKLPIKASIFAKPFGLSTMFFLILSSEVCVHVVALLPCLQAPAESPKIQVAALEGPVLFRAINNKSLELVPSCPELYPIQTLLLPVVRVPPAL